MRSRASSSAISAGIANAYLPGRLEVLADRPKLIIDGAHNADAALQLARAINENFRLRSDDPGDRHAQHPSGGKRAAASRADGIQDHRDPVPMGESLFPPGKWPRRPGGSADDVEVIERCPGRG